MKIKVRLEMTHYIKRVKLHSPPTKQINYQMVYSIIFNDFVIF